MSGGLGGGGGDGGGGGGEICWGHPYRAEGSIKNRGEASIKSIKTV